MTLFSIIIFIIVIGSFGETEILFGLLTTYNLYELHLMWTSKSPFPSVNQCANKKSGVYSFLLSELK